MRLRVREAWTASYADPIRLSAGDAVVLDGRRDNWDGHWWLWGQAPDGRAGWLPDSLLEGSGGTPRARHDYSAMELTCRAGDLLDGLGATHGWTWCRASDGREGWVPDRCLGPA